MLVDKKFSYAFKNYLTYEDEYQIETNLSFPVTGCNSWDIGFVHFVNMNTNVAEDTDLMVKQFRWIKKDMEAARARPQPPRWFILIGHHGALTVTRMKAPQQMIPFVEDLGFDLVIVGHHHSYSRSKPVLMNIKKQVESAIGTTLYEGSGTAIQNAVYKIGYLEAKLTGVGADQTTPEGNAASASAYLNEKNGVYWIMCQATGFKLQSNKDLEKTPTPWWYGYTGEHPYNPSFLMWDIGYNDIKFKCIGVTGVMVYDEKLKSYVLNDKISMDQLGQKIYDSGTIKHRSLR